MKLIELDPGDLFDQLGDLCHPIVYCNGLLSALIRSTENGSPHIFGGPLPSGFLPPSGADLHTLISLEAKSCPPIERIQHSVLPLIFPFRHNGGELKYNIQDEEIRIESLDPAISSENWPYSNFPKELPTGRYNATVPFDCPNEKFLNIIHQEPPDAKDEDAIVVVPPRDDYEVSLWGESGDAEGVLCVFLYDVETNTVLARNQCS